MSMRLLVRIPSKMKTWLKPRKYLRMGHLVTFLVAAILATGLAVWMIQGGKKRPYTPAWPFSSGFHPLDVKKPDTPTADQLVKPARIIKGVIRPGETFNIILDRQRVDKRVSAEVIRGLSTVIDFKRCRPGESFCLSLDQQGHVMQCLYEKSPFEVYRLQPSRKNLQMLEARRVPVSLERRVSRISGIIEHSLFNSFGKAGAATRLTVAFADIFSSQIDFNTESRPGDYFELIYERYFKDGALVGYGRILAARYCSPGLRDLEAYYYEPTGKKSGCYYDASGAELGASFLRSPLPVYRLTSRFTKRRFHPILKVYRPHYGVDLAAPIGTPVMAAADGWVKFVGWQRGFGRIVILHHRGGYKTYYGHLSRFGHGIRKGIKVKQKQIIGYVGSSGLATGPHLDYRIKQNGVFKNPFSLRFKPRSRLEGQELKRFRIYIRKWRQNLKEGDDKGTLFIETKKFMGPPSGWSG